MIPQNEREETGLDFSDPVELLDKELKFIELRGDSLELGISELVILELFYELEIVFESRELSETLFEEETALKIVNFSAKLIKGVVVINFEFLKHVKKVNNFGTVLFF